MSTGYETFTKTVLDVSAQLLADERRIRDALTEAARIGDTARVVDILDRWDRLPAAEVLAEHAGDTPSGAGPMRTPGVAVGGVPADAGRTRPARRGAREP